MYHIFKSNRLITDLSALGPNGTEIFRVQMPEYVKLVQEETGRTAKVDAESYTLTTFADLADLRDEHIASFQEQIPALVHTLKEAALGLDKGKSIEHIIPFVTFIPGKPVSIESTLETQDAETQ